MKNSVIPSRFFVALLLCTGLSFIGSGLPVIQNQSISDTQKHTPSIWLTGITQFLSQLVCLTPFLGKA
jgi:hypothetical protein